MLTWRLRIEGSWQSVDPPATSGANHVPIYFILVLPVSRLLQLLERNKAATTRDCPECTMSIPVAARRCPQCTSDLTKG